MSEWKSNSSHDNCTCEFVEIILAVKVMYNVRLKSILLFYVSNM